MKHFIFVFMIILIKFLYQNNRECKYALFTHFKIEPKIIIDIPSVIFIIIPETFDIEELINIVMKLLEQMQDKL